MYDYRSSSYSFFFLLPHDDIAHCTTHYYTTVVNRRKFSNGRELRLLRSLNSESSSVESEFMCVLYMDVCECTELQTIRKLKGKRENL